MLTDTTSPIEKPTSRRATATADIMRAAALAVWMIVDCVPLSRPSVADVATEYFWNSPTAFVYHLTYPTRRA
jgi:hypothetical protein